MRTINLRLTQEEFDAACASLNEYYRRNPEAEPWALLRGLSDEEWFKADSLEGDFLSPTEGPGSYFGKP